MQLGEHGCETRLNGKRLEAQARREPRLSPTSPANSRWTPAMNAITKPNATKATPPDAPAREMADLTDVFRMRLKREAGIYSISDQSLPSNDERNALAVRRAQLQAAIGGTSKAEIAARIARLFLRFPSARADAEATTAAYATDLMNYPLWAIDRGIMKAIETWKSAFAPSSPELRAMVAAEAKPFTEELRDLTAILDAQVFHDLPADERARVSAQFAQLIADLGVHSPLRRKANVSTKAEAEAWLEAHKGEPLPTLSPAAIAKTDAREIAA